MPTGNVVLSDHQQALVECLFHSGRYQNASEGLLEGLRLIEARDRVERAQLVVALRDIAMQSKRSGSLALPELGGGVLSWHLRLSRHHVGTVGLVHKPRHFIMNRGELDLLVVGRVLHDATKLAKHLDADNSWTKPDRRIATGGSVPNEKKTPAVEAAAVADSLAKLLSDFRTQCEVEGLLPTYRKVYRHFLGHDAYVGYSLDDWLRDAEFRYEALHGEREYYRISIVMAHVASAKADMDRGKYAAAKKLLQVAEMLRHDLKGDLPSMYVDPSIGDRRPSQRGGLVKDVNRKCRAILSCLEDNHKLDGKDFKSLAEAVEYGIEMWIAEEQFDSIDSLKQLKDSLHWVFKDWLRVNTDEAERFKVCTGFAWNE